jgi:hypothetical protein
MTRKDYRLIAETLVEVRPENSYDYRQWEIIVSRIARMLYANSKYDINGNKFFNESTFYRECTA